MSQGAVQIVIVGEDAVHHALGERLCVARAQLLAERRGDDWFDPASALRFGGAPWSAAVGFVRLADSPPERVHGHLHGRPLSPAVAKWRKILINLARLPDPPELVVILQDTDGHLGLVDSAKHLLEAPGALPTPAVIGLPHQMGEAWLLSLAPRDPAEAARLRQARAALGVDPAREPERLPRGDDPASRPKRVLRYVLLGEGALAGGALPEDRPPEPNQARSLAQELGEQLRGSPAHAGSLLRAFTDALDAALAKVLVEHLSPG